MISDLMSSRVPSRSMKLILNLLVTKFNMHNNFFQYYYRAPHTPPLGIAPRNKDEA
jgi:hypothetical protein